MTCQRCGIGKLILHPDAGLGVYCRCNHCKVVHKL